jgi:hypothetical protein
LQSRFFPAKISFPKYKRNFGGKNERGPILNFDSLKRKNSPSVPPDPETSTQNMKFQLNSTVHTQFPATFVQVHQTEKYKNKISVNQKNFSEMFFMKIL